MKLFVILFIIAVSINVGFYNHYGLYFGKDDIVNYQRLIYEPDLFHLNTYVLNSIFGEYYLFNYIMPFIVFIIFPYSMRKAYKNYKLILLSSGLLYFYWIVGLYSQCIAHCFFNFYLGGKKSKYLILAVANHPITLIAYGLLRGKLLMLIPPIALVIYIFPSSFLNYTVLRPDQFIPGMLFILLNPIFYFNRSKTDLIFYLGLFSSNMRISFYFIGEKLKHIPETRNYYIISSIWFIFCFFLHYYMMLLNRL